MLVPNEHFCGFPVHEVTYQTSFLHCTKHRLDSTGCVSFNFRRNQTDTKSNACAVIAAKKAPNLDFAGEAWDDGNGGGGGGGVGVGGEKWEMYKIENLDPDEYM